MASKSSSIIDSLGNPSSYEVFHTAYQSFAEIQENNYRIGSNNGSNGLIDH